MTIPFFGAGVVELPPRGFKRAKNSRKMQMVFFVHEGKVLVEVGATGLEVNEFALSKGGCWVVPRGKLFPFYFESLPTALQSIFRTDNLRKGPIPLCSAQVKANLDRLLSRTRILVRGYSVCEAVNTPQERNQIVAVLRNAASLAMRVTVAVNRCNHCCHFNALSHRCTARAAAQPHTAHDRAWTPNCATEQSLAWLQGKKPTTSTPPPALSTAPVHAGSRMQ